MFDKLVHLFGHSYCMSTVHKLWIKVLHMTGLYCYRVTWYSLGIYGTFSLVTKYLVLIFLIVMECVHNCIACLPLLHRFCIKLSILFHFTHIFCSQKKTTIIWHCLNVLDAQHSAGWGGVGYWCCIEISRATKQFHKAFNTICISWNFEIVWYRPLQD